MEHLRPVGLLFLLFLAVMALYHGVPTGTEKGIVLGSQLKVVNATAYSKGIFNNFRATTLYVDIDNGGIVEVESKREFDKNDLVLLKRYYSILRRRYWYQLSG